MSTPAIELLTYLQKEWGVLTKSPWTFAFALVIAFFCAYLACKWRYGGIIANLREQNATLKEKTKNKDVRIDARQMHAQASRTALTSLSNPELREKTIEIVKQMREFLLNNQFEFQRIVDEHPSQMNAATPDEERRSLLKTHNESLTRWNLKYKSDFDDRFCVDTILYRNELLLRLGIDMANSGLISKYQEDTNLSSIRWIANHLEELAKSLPL